MRERTARYRRTPEGWAKNSLINARASSKRRGLNPPTLTWRWIAERLEESGMECPCCGYTLSIGNDTSRHHSPSLERIDELRGYHTNNVVLVCMGCNAARFTRTIESYIQWLRRADRIVNFYAQFVRNKELIT